MCTYTTSGAKANGTTTPCAVASGQAARQSPCIIPSEGRQHRRVTLILFPHVSKCQETAWIILSFIILIPIILLDKMTRFTLT